LLHHVRVSLRVMSQPRRNRARMFLVPKQVLRRDAE
jgi:hypothetical protein